MPGWREDGLLLGVRPFGEQSCVADILTRKMGRVNGLVRGAKSPALRSLLQPGQLVRAQWRARLDEHLGYYNLEPASAPHAPHAWFDDFAALLAVQTLCALLRHLPEREPHRRLYDSACDLCAGLSHKEEWPLNFVRFELLYLEDVGFGLDWRACAVSGETQGLAFVSPETGRAVTLAGAGEWRDKLFPLPKFLLRQETLTEKNVTASKEEIQQGFALTGHFLAHRVFGGEGLPPCRSDLVGRLA